MHLLVAVVHDEEALDEVLTVLLEHELLHSVVVEARTGLELLERDLPIFAGLRVLVPGGIDFCRLVLCPVPSAYGESLLAELERVHLDPEDRPGFALLLPPAPMVRV